MKPIDWTKVKKGTRIKLLLGGRVVNATFLEYRGSNVAQVGYDVPGMKYQFVADAFLAGALIRRTP